MIKSEKFADKKILLIDKDAKKNNDRTWCFWEQENGFFDEIVYKKWDTVSFLSDTFSSEMEISPYQYKMIRGSDFYQYCFTEIGKHENIEFVQTHIDGWMYNNKSAEISIGDSTFRFENTVLFNSIYRADSSALKPTILLQHFKGWVIETEKNVFDCSKATMMDFRVHQQHGTSFAYVLPFNETTALVEYTLFTKELLKQDQYDEELAGYIKSFLAIDKYEIKEQEFGVIPMSNEKLPFERNGWNIGTAGGQTKGSSGYTFQFIQKQSQRITNQLVSGKSLRELPAIKKRFRFYDNTLLHILYNNTLPGKEIFRTLFRKNKPQQVLKFLDNESTIKEEFKIISSFPTGPFLKAAIKQL